jgi:hypothetical protein
MNTGDRRKGDKGMNGTKEIKRMRELFQHERGRMGKE